MTAKIDFYSYGLKPLYSFEQLVIGPNNQFAVSACQAVAKALGETYNPLFVYGPPGVGKTHLVQAVAQEVLKSNPELKVRYISAERFMSEVIAAISDDNVMTARQHFSDLELLIIDDIQYLTQSQSSQEELSHIFNNMQHVNHQLVLASDRPPNQLSGLNKTLRSRLEGGLATDVKLPDVSMRMEILRRKGEIQGVRLPDELLLYVAQRLRSNVRELEGFLKRMHAYVTLSHQEINEMLVQSVVREVLPEGMADIPAEDLEMPAPKAAAAPPPPPPPPVKHAAPPPAPKPAPAPAPAPVAPPPPPPVKPANGTNGETKKNGTHKKPPPPPMEEPPLPPTPPVEESPAPLPSSVEILNNQSMASRVDRVAPKPPREVAPAAKAPPPPPPPPAPEPEPIEEVVEAVADIETLGQKEIGAVFFFPSGGEKALESVHTKFQEVIKKHKLKFRLRRVHSEVYHTQGKTNYSSFVEVCKRNKVPVAVVIGPPPEAHIPEQDFYDLLSVTLDVQGVSLQLINWAEIDKDYRYLNLALDIALVRTR